MAPLSPTSRRRRGFLPAALCASIGTTIAAQTPPENDGPYAAGSRTLSVPGRPGGNNSVTLQVWYPAQSAGANAPIEPTALPAPLVVFGHGFSLSAGLYDSLYRHLATHGFVVAGVATEEGLLTGNLPRFVNDFAATVTGMRAAASDPSSPFLGAVAADTRANAAGHSFGGAAAIVAAADHPDLFASVTPMAATSTSPQGVDILGAARRLGVPVLHLGASADTIVPPPQNLDPLFQATPGDSLLVEILGGNHSAFHERWAIDRLLEPPGSISIAEQQRRIRRVWLPFLEWSLRDVTSRLDYLLGPTHRNDSGWSRSLARLTRGVLFGSGVPTLGSTFVLCPTRGVGDRALTFVAFGAGAGISTPFGEFRLDPTSTLVFADGVTGAGNFAPQPLGIPTDPTLIGFTLWFQSLLPVGSAPTGGGELTDSLQVVVR
ncbi:MAG: alpha/beta hydrolase family protein [Planctomycetota bacterium]